ncbi:hypothetical protein BDU57DRAFT_515149 [Ampelomyces quisqualis]|uniref:Uncharacterized protein n=1 Tax=Ampelomyces quisqualis TaxID=50730 RepID=A0A6A5QSM3_AMPQU|nr:hypothetical protein BDU57DRAFT_515149 [Ampelomyces quisqualis]
MPPEQREKTDSEHEKRKQEQYKTVEKIYANIALTITSVNKSCSQLKSIKAQISNDIDTLPIPNTEKNLLKRREPRSIAISEDLSTNTAHALILENFEDTFRAEWKKVKRQSLEKREVFLFNKVTTLGKMQGDFKAGLAEKLGLDSSE